MGASADLEDEGFLKPWDQKMCSFADGIWLNPLETVEYDGALATVDCVETGVGGGAADTESKGGGANVVQHIRSSLSHIWSYREICREWVIGFERVSETERERRGFMVK